MSNYKKFIYVSSTTNVGSGKTYETEVAKWTAEVAPHIVSGGKYEKSVIFREATHELYKGGITYGLSVADAARISALESSSSQYEAAKQLLTDYSKPSAYSAVAATDTIAGSIGKLEAGLNAAQTDITANAVKLTVKDTPNTGYLKTYVLSKGTDNTLIGEIDIPKDLVVTAGAVVVNPAGQTAGTYIQLTIANQATPIYINVKDLVDVYTAQQSAAQVQVTISDSNVISASIVAKSVTATELSDAVNASLGKADSAIQGVTTQVIKGSETTATDASNDYYLYAETDDNKNAKITAKVSAVSKTRGVVPTFNEDGSVKTEKTAPSIGALTNTLLDASDAMGAVSNFVKDSVDIAVAELENEFSWIEV